MNTTIVNIESVYELATSKGYKSPYYMPVNSDVQLYLIQSWLIDKQKIWVETKIDFNAGYFFSLFEVATKSIRKINADKKASFETFDYCLLNGINEALNLI